MTLTILWLMLFGSVVSEIAIAWAMPWYRKLAHENLKINLVGSVIIALVWAVIAGVIGGGGGIAATLVPISVPIATVITIPFYHIMAWIDNNGDTIADSKEKIRQVYTGFWFLLRLALFPVRQLGKLLLWASSKTS